MPQTLKVRLKVHELKTVHEYFVGVWDGSKTFEIRNNDRDFDRGDILVLRETDFDEPVTRVVVAEVTYTLRSFVGLAPGFVALGLRVIEKLQAGEYKRPPSPFK